MLRLFVIVLFSQSILFAASYQIRLGTFESYAALKASLSKLQDPRYKEKLSIEQDEAGFTLYSKVYTQQSQAQRALAIYRETFQEASIKRDGVDIPSPKSAETPALGENTASKSELWGSVRTHSPQNPKPSLQSRDTTLQQPQNPLPKQQKNLSFAKELQRKVFYVCYEGKSNRRIKPVIKAVFSQNYITYSSTMLEVPPIPTPYRLVHNELHISVGMFSVGSTISRLDRVTNEYLRTINWADGKPVQSVRLYFKERDAMAFARRN